MLQWHTVHFFESGWLCWCSEFIILLSNQQLPRLVLFSMVFYEPCQLKALVSCPRSLEAQNQTNLLGGFIPICGQMIQFDKHIFPIGCNHQVDLYGFSGRKVFKMALLDGSDWVFQKTDKQLKFLWERYCSIDRVSGHCRNILYSFSWLWNSSNSTSYLTSPLQQTCFIFLSPLKNVTRSLVLQNFFRVVDSFTPLSPSTEIEASRMLHVRLVGVDTQLGVFMFVWSVAVGQFEESP